MKTFLSIGTGPGIGLATAERFAREGFRVILSSRDLNKTFELAQGLGKQGFTVATYQVDASDAGSINQLINSVNAKYGAIDVVHYNAANLRQAALADQPTDTFASDLAVNIAGAMVTAQSVMPGMAAHGSGSILLTGGGFGVTPNPDYLSLSLGKAGIRALALGLFESAKDQGVHVATVTVCAFVKPGSIEAHGVADAFWSLHAQDKDAWGAELTYAP
ncbi:MULTISPECIES: SDR family NAD(P)-dependent oxidoreductase [Pseudomonas]|uniref:SDR family NAD(P)-dependent oxidoreductase n=1 Tax=Pseudomonas quercus TaxID=2722792 RepID=A0ABX0YE18_9PSED|nr:MULTISPECIES: SDR family NAD(P)-dependent oxidoreductase [Pseudomonas]MBF7143276.1 SDR family NAD(P)-dependent oxidoreductase [Pseudomonas sp. LY10J]NJP01580.1 SDR family NAD(P)-dependent oxidoreductase [Pseudomonas quercus]